MNLSNDFLEITLMMEYTKLAIQNILKEISNINDVKYIKKSNGIFFEIFF